MRLAFVTLAVLAGLASAARGAADPLDSGWANPPRSARLRAYWWWLNGCVTKEAITRDLEQMKAKGFGGALICDADGSSQDGNERAPHGPTFLSPEWRELYRHTLREADRLGLEMSLNIQSGWNLGGPMVTADDAAKRLTWSELRVEGPCRGGVRLPDPPRRDGYYRDAFVVAYCVRPASAAGLSGRVTANSAQKSHPAALLADGDPETFWVSEGAAPGDGPSADRPAWVRIELDKPARVSRLVVTPRGGYGPKEAVLQAASDGAGYRTVKRFAMKSQPAVVELPTVRGRVFRLVITGAYDRRFPQSPRSVQIAELQLIGPDGAWPAPAERPRLLHWRLKAGHDSLHFSAPDTSVLLAQAPSRPGDYDTLAADVVDLTGALDEHGVLRWDAPPGDWLVLRFGYTIGDRSYVSTCSEGWDGYALDVLDAGAFVRYWDAVVATLIADAGPLAGRTLKYLHTDSWEVEPLNWTPAMREEFRKRRGYDLLPWAPALTGRIVESREASNRFLHDFRKTLGDLAIDHHYRLFRERAHRHGLRIHPESGGPHAVPIDAQRCLGFNDVPMSEFWAWSWRHRIGDDNRFFVKQPASAAHTYGRSLVAAEGFTTIGPHWQETLWDNLKPAFDKACCEGLNLLVWHEFVCSPPEQGLPGIQYFAGTHLNPNVTWWSKSAPFFDYINRCQFLLQQGKFVADVCYYYGDHVPNFAQHKRTDPARVLPGYDYDVITEEALLDRATVENGRIVLPDGMSYRVLVLREQQAISLPVLRKVQQLVDGGATVVGPKPDRGTSLTDNDGDVRRIAARLWDTGRVTADKTARQVLLEAGVAPDFDVMDGSPDLDLDYIHRRTETADIYFVANRAKAGGRARCAFRVAGKAPELWDPVTGERRFATAYQQAGPRTIVPLAFAPCGSWFVIFRRPASEHPPVGRANWASRRVLQTLAGPWRVRFDPRWGGPGEVVFPELVSWTERREPGVRYYSGTAVYRKAFTLSEKAAGGDARLWLDLGAVRELAEVRVNGRSCGVAWTPPFRVDITGVAKPGANELEIDVVNFWPNRIIGDAASPPDQRLTRTNIRKLTQDTELMPSGLFGPVTVQLIEP